MEIFPSKSKASRVCPVRAAALTGARRGHEHPPCWRSQKAGARLDLVDLAEHEVVAVRAVDDEHDVVAPR